MPDLSSQLKPAAVRGRALVAGVLAAVVVLLAAAVLVGQETAGPGVPPPTPKPSPPRQPASGSVDRDRPAYTEMNAENSRLYNLRFDRSQGECAASAQRRPPVPDAQLAAQLQGIADCLAELHAPELARQQIPVSTPRVRGFSVQVETACGVLTRYAFYCPEDRTIYVDTRSDDSWRFYGGMRLGYFAVVSHEFGHHLQLAGGITQGYAERLESAGEEQGLELSRRAELQAACFSGIAYGALWNSLGGSAADRAQVADYFERQSDDTTREGTHGSARAMKLWFDRGFGAEAGSEYRACNTWVARADEVD